MDDHARKGLKTGLKSLIDSGAFSCFFSRSAKLEYAIEALAWSHLQFACLVSVYKSDSRNSFRFLVVRWPDGQWGAHLFPRYGATVGGTGRTLKAAFSKMKAKIKEAS